MENIKIVIAGFISLLIVGLVGAQTYYSGYFKGREDTYVKLLGKKEGLTTLSCHQAGGEIFSSNMGGVCLLKNEE